MFISQDSSVEKKINYLRNKMFSLEILMKVFNLFNKKMTTEIKTIFKLMKQILNTQSRKNT